MSRNDFIIGMIQSFVSNDLEEFKEECYELIKFENEKGNYKLANKFRNALENEQYNKGNLSTQGTYTLEPFVFKEDIKNISENSLLEFVKPDVNLNDLVLRDEIINEIKIFIEQWNLSSEFSKYNLRPQNKLLFYGLPGTGKTMAAQCIANELNLNLAYINFDQLISSYLGKTAENLGEIFKTVRNENCVLLIDELDAIGKKRDDIQELGELKRIVISLLQNLDNFSNEIILIACTNHPHLLDPALSRRFDNNIEFSLPGDSERKIFIQSILEKKNVQITRDWVQFISSITIEFSPATIQKCIENGLRKWILNKSLYKENKRNNIHIKIIEEILKHLDVKKMDISKKIEISSLLRQNNSRIYTLEYLSNLFYIPKSTLHKKLNEGEL